MSSGGGIRLITSAFSFSRSFRLWIFWSRHQASLILHPSSGFVFTLVSSTTKLDSTSTIQFWLIQLTGSIPTYFQVNSGSHLSKPNPIFRDIIVSNILRGTRWSESSFNYIPLFSFSFSSPPRLTTLWLYFPHSLTKFQKRDPVPSDSPRFTQSCLLLPLKSTFPKQLKTIWGKHFSHKTITPSNFFHEKYWLILSKWVYW